MVNERRSIFDKIVHRKKSNRTCIERRRIVEKCDRREDAEQEDERFAEEMMHDEKERAEHVMLVDLGRNDVGRVSEFGTVKVDKLMFVERYSHVMHIVSAISGKLPTVRSSVELRQRVIITNIIADCQRLRLVSRPSGGRGSTRQSAITQANAINGRHTASAEANCFPKRSAIHNFGAIWAIVVAPDRNAK